MTLYEKAVAAMDSKDIFSSGAHLELKKNEISDKLISEYEHKFLVRTFKNNYRGNEETWYRISFEGKKK